MLYSGTITRKYPRDKRRYTDDRTCKHVQVNPYFHVIHQKNDCEMEMFCVLYYVMHEKTRNKIKHSGN